MPSSSRISPRYAVSKTRAWEVGQFYCYFRVRRKCLLRRRREFSSRIP